MGLGNVVKGLGEYFLGTESYKYWKREKAITKEFSLDKQDLKDRVYEIKTYIYMDVFLKKVVPTLFDIGSVICSIATKTPEYLGGIAIGEAWRAFSYKFYDSVKETRQKQKEIDIMRERKFQAEEENKKSDEGEEWKKGKYDF